MYSLYLYCFVTSTSVFCGCISFVSSRKHLLNVLISLEYIILSLSWEFMGVLCGSEIYFMLFFFTLAACEGALGLGLLVSIVRIHGSDGFKSFSSLQC